MSAKTDLDTVESILAATFGPVVTREVIEEAKVEEAEARKLPSWWKYNQDGTPRKTSAAPQFRSSLGLSISGRADGSDLKTLRALLAGAETYTQVQEATKMAPLTVRRSLSRLISAGLVEMFKAPATGSVGRRAYLHRPLVQDVPVEVETASAGEDAGAGVGTGFEADPTPATSDTGVSDDSVIEADPTFATSSAGADAGSKIEADPTLAAPDTGVSGVSTIEG